MVESASRPAENSDLELTSKVRVSAEGRLWRWGLRMCMDAAAVSIEATRRFESRIGWAEAAGPSHTDSVWYKKQRGKHRYRKKEDTSNLRNSSLSRGAARLLSSA